MSEMIALFPYEASNNHQLSLVVGDRLTVLQATRAGWCIGCKSDGSMGLFPSAYCKPVDPGATDDGNASGGAGGGRGLQQFAVSSEAKFGQLQQQQSRPPIVSSLAPSLVTSAATSQAASPNGSVQFSRGYDRPSAAGRGSGGSPDSWRIQQQRQSRVLREELGLDDSEDDGDEPNRNVGGLTNSGAGAGGLSSSNVSSRRSGGGDSAFDRLLDEVQLLRTLKSHCDRDVDRIRRTVETKEKDREQVDRGIKTLKEKKDELVRQVQRGALQIDDIQQRIDVIRCAFMDEPLPTYNPPTEFVSMAAVSTPTSMLPTPTDDSDVEQQAGPLVPDGGSSRIKSSTDITDAKLQKTGAKYERRIAESLSIEQEYLAKMNKAEKKIAKAKAALEQAKADAAARKAADLAAKGAAAEQAKTESEQAKAEFEVAKAAYEAAHGRLTELETAIRKAEKKLLKGDAARAEKEAAIAELEAKNASLQTSAAERKARIAALQKEAKAAEAAAIAAEDMRAKVELEEASANTQLKQRIEIERARIAEYKGKIEAYKKQQAAPDG